MFDSRIAATFALLSSLSGCAIYLDGVPPCTGPSCPVVCRTDGDCAVGSYCADTTSTQNQRLCTASSTCTADSQCGTNFWCDFRGTCVPERGCRTNSDCTGTQVCVESVCRERSDVCQFDYQCGAGRSCVNNACVAICTTNAECGSGQQCRTGLCVAVPECTSTSQCGSGERCVAGECLPDCISSRTCGATDVCESDSFCHPIWRPRPFCQRDTDCAAGHVCRMGACRTPCPTTTSTECRSFDIQLPVCQANPVMTSEYLCYATVETAPECATQTDCGAGRRCVDGQCRNNP